MLLPIYGLAATCSSTGTGDWNAAGTWINCGGLVPQAADGVRIISPHVVTIPAGHTTEAIAYAIIGYSAGDSSNTASVIVNGTLNFATSIQVGNNSATTDGNIVFGPGGQLAASDGAATFTMENGSYASTATKVDPFIINDGVTISTSGTAPKMDIQLSNVSFRNTSDAITITPGDTTGTKTSQVVLSNNTFNATGNVTIGHAVNTPNTVPITLLNNDFRDVAGVIIQRVTGGAADYIFTGNTGFSTGAVKAIVLNGSNGLTMNGNVLFLYTLSASATTGGHILTSNFIGRNDSLGVLADFDDTAPGWTVGGSGTNGNYFFSNVENAHLLQTSGAATGSGAHTFSYNVLHAELPAIPVDGADGLMLGATPLPTVCTNNVAINTSTITENNVTDDSAPFETNNLTVKNNTASVATNSFHYAGLIWAAESNGQLGTGISLANNLALGNADGTDTAFYSHAGNAAYTIDSSDYNNTYAVSSYSNVAATAGKAADQAVDPKPIDYTRCLAKWNLKFGSGTDSSDDAITYLLGINGYRGTPNFDQNGTASAYGPTHLVEWVRYGFSPTNGALRKAGDPADGRPTIGAMEWQNPRRKRM